MSRINNAIIISDSHCGCQYGLCPPQIRLDGGGVYRISKWQKIILDCWESFWSNWVPVVTRNEPYCVIINGDIMDHRHHKVTTLVSASLSDQANIAYEMFAPVAERCDGRLYIIRGTEAHTGPAGEAEEQLAERLKAIPDESGLRSRFELFIKIGKCLVHATHHIGTTSSLAYETTAIMKELSESFSNASRWKEKAPDIIIRSHRHIHTEVRIPTGNVNAYAFVTSGWQLKTPFVYRMPGGRVRAPTIGGSLVRQGDEEFFTRHKTWSLDRPKTEKPKG